MFKTSGRRALTLAYCVQLRRICCCRACQSPADRLPTACQPAKQREVRFHEAPHHEFVVSIRAVTGTCRSTTRELHPTSLANTVALEQACKPQRAKLDCSFLFPVRFFSGFPVSLPYRSRGAFCRKCRLLPPFAAFLRCCTSLLPRFTLKFCIVNVSTSRHVLEY